jgi:hypothetical protein
MDHLLTVNVKQIHNWLQNHKNKVTHSNVWTPLLRHLNELPSVPRKPNISQFVMGHKSYKDQVDAEFVEHIEEEDTPTEAHMALRCKIAKDLFDAEDAETQARLRKENEDEHSALVAAAEQAASEPLAGISPDDKQT